MDKKRLFERVLGAVLVSAFGFILYSAFLDSSGHVQVDRSTQIPVQSQFLDPLEIDDEPTSLPQPVKTASDIFVPSQKVTGEEALQDEVLSENGLPNAWVIQVGSFSGLEKADEIRDRLSAKFYKAYHRKLDPADSEGVLYRVMIGPYMNAEEAVRHQREVDQMLGLSTLLMKFEP